MKILAVVTIVVALAVLLAGCVTMSLKVPVSRDRIAAALDISEIGIHVLFRIAEREGADVTAAREQSAAVFAYMRALLQLEFKSINQQDLRLAIDDLRAVVAATADLCRSFGIDEKTVSLHERYIERTLDALEIMLDATTKGN